MAKFVIECPQCGKYVEARTGLFAKNKIACSCGNIINVRNDKLTSRVCPHCGNSVVFDQSKGEKAKCPVCAQPINTMAERNKMVEISCVQCGIHLLTGKGEDTYTCPVCGCVNKVEERIVSEQIRKDGLASVIKYEGDNNTFVWKHPIEDFNYGSQLIVHENQEAIFFRDGQALDTFGPGRYTIETQQLPMLEKIYKLPTDTEGTFHSEVYFVNKSVQMSIKWGTPEFIHFLDPLTGSPLEIGASGELNLQVDNSRKLLTKLVGTTKGISWEGGPGMTKSLQECFVPMISLAVKTDFSEVIKQEAIDLLEIDSKLNILSARLKESVSKGFEEYGLTVPQFYVRRVVLPEDNPNFQTIRRLHQIELEKRRIAAEADVRTTEERKKAEVEAARREAVLQAQTTETEIARKEAERKVIAAQAEAQALRMNGLTEAEIMQAKGYTEKDVLQAEVQKEYAKSLGQMGSNISTGGTSSGGNSGVMGDILSMGVGLAAAKSIVPEIGNMFSGMNGQQNQDTSDNKNETKAANANSGWTCPACGYTGNTGKFCQECAAPKPQINPGWTCPACGYTGNTGKFCQECAAPKPQINPGWTCPACGHTGNTGKFCEECAAPKTE